MSQRTDPSPRRAGAEEPIEVRRYLDALRRGRRLILAIVAVLVIATVAVSAALPKTYRASASIVKQVTTAPFETVNVDSLTRELNTIDQLLTTSDVLGAAARKVPGETVASLDDKVGSRVDPDANLIFVTADARDPDRAARIANAVAETFVADQRRITRDQYVAARARLSQELDRVRSQGGGVAQQEAIRQRLSELGVALASAGTDLSLAERAVPPDGPSAPKPLRNGVLALFLGLFLGVIVVLGRDQLVPRVSGPRELSRLLDLPVLATIPYVGRRAGRRAGVLSGVEHESYQSLGASVRFALPTVEGEPRILLVTSALHAEGKSTVTARLGRALSQAGHRTLVVSADLRWPTLQAMFEIDTEPGLADLLAAVEDDPDARSLDALFAEAIVPVQEPARRGVLHALPSGRKPSDPARLLSGRGVAAVLGALAELDYDYILVDSAPILGIADTQALAGRIRHVLYVARLDRITLDNVVDARDLLDRFDVELLGMVVVGARSEASPYYLNPRAGAPALEDA